MLLTLSLLIVDTLFFVAAAVFTYESRRESEPRATKVGWAGMLSCVVLGLIIVLIPGSRAPLAVLFGLIVLVSALFLIPSTGTTNALRGAMAHVTGDVKRYDERDMVFARNSIPPDTEMYSEYYARHPEYEQQDAERRAKGGTVGPRPGAIDKGHPPNIAMTQSAYCVLPTLGPHAVADPSADKPHPSRLSPEKASEIVKGYALHLGAGVVGICKVNPLWTYSHRGECPFNNWDEWGEEIHDPLPYAVVIGTEMSADLVNASPHTPAHVETRLNYAQGVYITTVLAHWFAHLGFKAVAHHRVHYDHLMVPMAIDAGLGQLGRFGYVITKEFGARVRIFAVTTEMPLAPDRPIDIGADEFCQECKKCATSCPSHSIPAGDKTVADGQEKWRINAETCFEYWGNVGTACAICMGICPYSRPYKSVHRVVRSILARSNLARRFFPHIDNVIYGQKWKPKPVPPWIDYRA